MSCNFNLSHQGKAAEYIKSAKKAIKKAGGTYEGTDDGGDFHIPSPLGKIEGTFAVTKTEIEIVITKKPFIISCSRIEKELKKYAGG